MYYAITKATATIPHDPTKWLPYCGDTDLIAVHDGVRHEFDSVREVCEWLTAEGRVGYAVPAPPRGPLLSDEARRCIRDLRRKLVRERDATASAVQYVAALQLRVDEQDATIAELRSQNVGLKLRAERQSKEITALRQALVPISAERTMYKDLERPPTLTIDPKWTNVADLKTGDQFFCSASESAPVLTMLDSPPSFNSMAFVPAVDPKANRLHWIDRTGRVHRAWAAAPPTTTSDRVPPMADATPVTVHAVNKARSELAGKINRNVLLSDLERILDTLAGGAK